MFLKQLKLVHVVKTFSKYQQFATQLEYTQGLWPYPEIDLVWSDIGCPCAQYKFITLGTNLHQCPDLVNYLSQTNSIKSWPNSWSWTRVWKSQKHFHEINHCIPHSWLKVTYMVYAIGTCCATVRMQQKPGPLQKHLRIWASYIGKPPWSS